MASLSSCRSCKGFVPSTEDQCPHCGAKVASPYRAAGHKVLAVLGGIAVPLTLMACYGGPPCDANCQAKADDGGVSDGGYVDGGNTDGGTRDGG